MLARFAFFILCHALYVYILYSYLFAHAVIFVSRSIVTISVPPLCQRTALISARFVRVMRACNIVDAKIWYCCSVVLHVICIIRMFCICLQFVVLPQTHKNAEEMFLKKYVVRLPSI